MAFVLSQASSINAVSTGFTTLETLERRLSNAFSDALPRDIAATVVFDLPFSLLRVS